MSRGTRSSFTFLSIVSILTASIWTAPVCVRDKALSLALFAHHTSQVMSDNSLPDEIISEILSPALKVADDVFSDTSRVSPFSNYSESTSAYLLVCKSWLRVATPLLYHVVVLRSTAQAKALAGALSMNNALGQFIKKLRVEGG